MTDAHARAIGSAMDPLVYDFAPTTTPQTFRRESDGAWMVVGDDIAEGIAVYDGVRELITPEAVQAYLPHIARLTVTLGHPTEEVTPDNVQRYGVGDVDGDPKVVTLPGGWTAVRSRRVLRRRDAIDAAERGEIIGLSLGHRPIRDNVSGVHPIFGAYDRRRIGVVDVNHTALCGDSERLPPPRIPTCGIYLDAAPPQGKTMTKRQARKLLRDALAAITITVDAVSFDKAIPLLKEFAADPMGLALLKSIIEGLEEEAEAPEAPAAMTEGAMDARIRAEIKPLIARLDALDAKIQPVIDATSAQTRAAKDAKDAADKADLARLVKHYALDASTDRAALLTWGRSKQIGGVTATDSDDAVYSALRAVASTSRSAPTPDAAPVTDATTLHF